MCGALGVVLGMSGALAVADDGFWRDVESRIQYGYYTEDAGALRPLGELLATADEHDRLRGYYAGLLAWRQALLAGRGAQAAELAEQCVQGLDNALAVQADFADALALRAICRGGLSGGSALLGALGARRDLERARELGPHNPRVLLLTALGEVSAGGAGGSKPSRNASTHALSALRQAVAAFETERRGTEQLPGWGAAEAWFLLARQLLDQGDAVAARDALEHALLIAPEYAAARRLLARIVSG